MKQQLRDLAKRISSLRVRIVRGVRPHRPQSSKTVKLIAKEERLKAIEASEKCYRKAKQAERAKDLGRLRSQLKKALNFDESACPADRRLLEKQPLKFQERREIQRLIRLRLMALRKKANTPSVRQDSGSPRVFVYWGQGFEHAPPIVQACQRELWRFHRPEDVVLLDDSNLHEWVTVPKNLELIRSKNRAHFSDYVRMALLAEYGGIWLDATCLPTTRMQDIFPLLIGGSGFYVFKLNNRGGISNWFLAAEKGNYMARLMHETLQLYWRIYEEPLFYFFFHAIFKELVQMDRKFQEAWNEISELEVDPNAVRRSFPTQKSTEQLNALCVGSFVHKLTYKHKPENIPDSCVERMIEDGFSPSGKWSQ